MANVRALNKDKYSISNYRFRELHYFCLQYNEWKEKVRELQEALKGIQYSDMPHSNNPGDPTFDIATKCAKYSSKCDVIEKAAKIADPELYSYIIYAVTNKDVTFNNLKARKDIPCERDRFYDRRRKFYFMLDILLNKQGGKDE